MFTEFFGNYLLNNGYIKADQLQDALEYQHNVRLKLGVLAVNAGYMTADEADKVNEEQKKVDKKFGELAVEMGFLKEEQVDELLSSQKLGHLLLGQALVDKKYITLQQFEKAVNEYKKAYSISDEEFEALERDDVEEIVEKFVEFKGSRNEKALKDYLALFLRNIIRFIDPNASFGNIERVDEYKALWVAAQNIRRKVYISTFIEADKDSFIKFASKFAEEELTTMDEMVQASVGEFLNLHNGIFLVNMSNEGVELELSPQEVFFKMNIKNVYVIPVNLSFGKINLLIREE